MRRRFFLTSVAIAALLCASLTIVGAQETRPDRIALEDFKALVEGGKPFLVLDVRGHIESKIKGAKHVPLDALEARLGELPRDREIVTYCA